MKTFDSHVEKIELIFKEWLRSLVYVFVAVIFTAFVASLGVLKASTGAEEFAKYVKDHASAVTYDFFFNKTLEIVGAATKPISFLLIAIFTSLFFYTILTIWRILKIDLRLKKDLRQHWDLHYYMILICFNSIFSGITSYIVSLWLGNYPSKIISIKWFIVCANFILSYVLVYLILKFALSKINKIFFIFTLSLLAFLNAYWIYMAFGKAIKILMSSISSLRFISCFLLVIFCIIISYEIRKTYLELIDD